MRQSGRRLARRGCRCEGASRCPRRRRPAHPGWLRLAVHLRPGIRPRGDLRAPDRQAFRLSAGAERTDTADRKRKPHLAVRHFPSRRPELTPGRLFFVSDLLDRLRTDYELWSSICYYIREAAGTVKPLRLRGGQRRRWLREQELLRTKGRCRMVLIKGRRGGFTTENESINLWVPWKDVGFDTMSLAASESDMFDLFEITRRAIDHFPAGLLGRLGDRQTTEVSFPARDSHYYTGTAGGKTTGRGKGLKRVHGSEWPLWPDIKGIVNGLLPAMQGVPHSSIVLEGTPSAYGSEAHVFWKEAVSGKNGFTAEFFPWWECDPITYRLALDEPDELGSLEEDEQLLIDRHGLCLEQLKWRRAEINGPGGRAYFFNNYPEDTEACWLAAGEKYFNAELMKRVALKCPPDGRLSDEGVQVWSALRDDEIAVLGADTAEGVDQDRSTFVVRAFPSWRLVAQYASPRVEPGEFARIIDRWGRLLGESSGGSPAFLVVEKNLHGITVLRDLRDAYKYPLHLIYKRTPLDEQRDEGTDKLGWATTGGVGGSQPLLLAAGFELLHAVDERQAQAPTAECMADFFGTVTGKNGKVSLNGKDLLVAEALAWVGRDAAIKAANTWKVRTPRPPGKAAVAPMNG